RAREQAVTLLIDRLLTRAVLLGERIRLKSNDASSFDATSRFISIRLTLSRHRAARSIRFVLRARHGGGISERQAWRVRAEADGQDRGGRTTTAAPRGR